MKRKKHKQGGVFKVEEDTELICPKCGEASIAAAWENMTQTSCETRLARRDYIKITSERARKKQSEVVYRCPECSAWSLGYEILIKR